MKIRTKALLTIVAITVTITVLSLLTGLFSIRDGVETIVAYDMKMIGSIASKLASERLELLKRETRSAADRLYNLSTGELIAPARITQMLEQEIQYYQHVSMALFDSEHKIVAAHGSNIPDISYAENEFAKRAYDGEVIVSSTETAKDGGLLIRVYAPINGYILVSTLPGLIISDLVDEFRILGSGNIFILDKTGTMIANSYLEPVLERRNLVEMAKERGRYNDDDGLFVRMTKGESGIGHYIRDDEKRICAYRPIAGSDGWSMGVSAPVSDTSVGQTERVLFISGAIIFAIGSIVAFFAAGVIAKPFESLRKMTRIAENASAAKSTFLANTSHEMRTPLNAIIGLSELALDAGELPEEDMDNLEKIYNSGVTLLGIVNDLLDIAKIESGKFELVPVDYDVPSTINDTRSLNILRLADKPIVFRLSIDETMPSRLHGDELRIKQIFNNLLSNACKYTHAGYIDWAVGWERDEGSEDGSIWLVSSIADTGVGVRQEDISKLFTDYNQVDTRSNRSIEGTGLGLAITRRLVEAMGGAIGIESVYGKGTTFTVRIRQKIASTSPIGPVTAEALCGFRYSANKRVRGKELIRVQMPYARVLVVDDVQTNLDVAKGIMKPYGMQIDCVTSGFEAVDLVRGATTRYDAIFMDHMMPEMDGMEATRIIREEIDSDYARTIPIIALTANAVIGNEEIFLRRGFQAFLTKPIDMLKMDAVLRQWVRRKELENGQETRELPAENVAGAANGNKKADCVDETDPGIDGLDWTAGLNRFGGDTSIYTSVIRSYLTNTARLLDQIRKVQEGTLAEYAIVIHGIKGSSYGVEARGIGKKAEELEYAAKAGNFDFVRRNNPLFIQAAEAFLARLAVLSDAARNDNDRPGSHAPDETLLARMEEAAANFRIDTMEEVMNALEGYAYETQTELIAWLREQVDRMEFTPICERLAQRKREAHKPAEERK